MNLDHEDFGRGLQRDREARSLTRLDVARTTKIPERTIASLEEGRVADLPADVFVRGFLRSYARCIGANPDHVVARWISVSAATSADAQVSVPTAFGPGMVEVSAPHISSSVEGSGSIDPAVAPPVVAPPVASSPPVAMAAPAVTVASVAVPSMEAMPVARSAPLDHVHAVVRALADVGHGARRMPLTLAVLILVIVATLTVSLLLRRPEPHRAGGISATPATSTSRRAPTA